MLKTFSAALIAVTALGVKVQTQSVVQAGAESLQVVPLKCASSVDIYLVSSNTTRALSSFLTCNFRNFLLKYLHSNMKICQKLCDIYTMFFLRS